MKTLTVEKLIEELMRASGGNYQAEVVIRMRSSHPDEFVGVESNHPNQVEIWLD